MGGGTWEGAQGEQDGKGGLAKSRSAGWEVGGWARAAGHRARRPTQQTQHGCAQKHPPPSASQPASGPLTSGQLASSAPGQPSRKSSSSLSRPASWRELGSLTAARTPSPCGISAPERTGTASEPGAARGGRAGGAWGRGPREQGAATPGHSSWRQRQRRNRPCCLTVTGLQASRAQLLQLPQPAHLPASRQLHPPLAAGRRAPAPPKPGRPGRAPLATQPQTAGRPDRCRRTCQGPAQV